jgi:hypothetical protein
LKIFSNLIVTLIAIPSNIGCQTLCTTTLKIIGSELVKNYTVAPWPEVKLQLDVLHKRLHSRIIDLQAVKVRKDDQNSRHFKNIAAIGVNNYSFANDLTVEAIIVKIIGDVRPKYKDVTNKFGCIAEFAFMPLANVEPTKKQSRFDFYKDIVENVAGSHFGRPFVLLKRVRESDRSIIRYCIAIPEDSNCSDPRFLSRMEEALVSVKTDILSLSVEYLKIDIDDILSEGRGMKSMIKSLDEILRPSDLFCCNGCNGCDRK